MKRFGSFWPLILTAAVLFLSFSCLVKSASGDLKLQAQLVWGTNNEKPDDPKLKEVDSNVTDKLRGVFKWKNYFEVHREGFNVAASGSKKVKMSDHCEIEVQNLGSSSVEVKLYGKGKLVVKKKQLLKPRELLVLAGDDKNDTAWFVVLSSSEN